jgi:hypothetical protein
MNEDIVRIGGSSRAGAQPSGCRIAGNLARLKRPELLELFGHGCSLKAALR